jgi:hypothetical protein
MREAGASRYIRYHALKFNSPSHVYGAAVALLR